jgi:Bacteriophage tail sheath protein
MSLSDNVDRGITVTEMAPMDQAIDVSPESTAAFVGRALRGPLDTPVLVHSLGEFRRRFGDVWTRSSLGPAVQQFFEHGGRNLYIVRVANNARGALLCLPASGSALVLRAREPGSTETIRAAVDYDRIDGNNDELFNLTLQRLDPVSGLVIDQEMYQRASYREASDAFIGDHLSASTIASMEKPFPTHRPEPTAGGDQPFGTVYLTAAQAGSDGRELSDYDLIGSRRHRTGLFSLRQVDGIDVLYLPPPGKERDLGLASLLAAEMFCREQGAMLIVDPACEWASAADAIAGIKGRGLTSPNAISYFPRMHVKHDRSMPGRAVGGALAGLLCKLDRTFGPWADLDRHGLGFRRELIVATRLVEADRQMLIREGLNVIASGPAGRARLRGAVTMARSAATRTRFTSLPVRRSCLKILGAADRATRWAVFEADDERLVARVQSQLTAYFAGLDNLGAFENDRFAIDCKVDSRGAAGRAGKRVAIVISFHPVGCRGPVSFTLHQQVTGCRITQSAFAPNIEDCA